MATKDAKIPIQFGEDKPKLSENKVFPNNKITLTKYNLLTFTP